MLGFTPLPFPNPRLIISNLVMESNMIIGINRRSRERIFLLPALRIPYLLLHRYSCDNRLKFVQEHPYLAEVYKYLLNIVGREVNLPVKKCKRCRISYLPDYRTKRHQKHCPYGCIELNRRRNKEKAKSRYRKTDKGLMKALQYNHSYRERKENGEISQVQEIKENKQEVERKLRAQIKFFYKKLTPEVDDEKLEQLDRILGKLSQKTYS